MKLGKTPKILIGLATIWVAIYPLLFFLVWLSIPLGFLLAESRDTPELGLLPTGLFALILPLHCLTIFLMMGLQAFYLIHVIKNNQASEVLRIVLGVGCFYLPFIAMPLYYLLFIWPERPPSWALAPSKTVTIESTESTQEETLGS